MSRPSNELGIFLRANRARIEPGDAGLPSGYQVRRVPGLRREEVAVLAGVSADYYARLEQGRERNPSPQVIAAIGRSLRLNSASMGHLYRLAGLNPQQFARHHSVHPALLDLLNSFPATAAYVLGPAFDVLATNPIATSLLAPFAPETNMPQILFTHPAARTVFPEWSEVASAAVHALHLNAGLFPADARIKEVVSDLAGNSVEFRDLWNDQSVGSLARAFKVFVHPDAGRIELTYQTFDVTDAPGQQLLVATPTAGSRSVEAFTYLAAITAA